MNNDVRHMPKAGCKACALDEIFGNAGRIHAHQLVDRAVVRRSEPGRITDENQPDLRSHMRCRSMCPHPGFASSKRSGLRAYGNISTLCKGLCNCTSILHNALLTVN
jgi:hypothetical protein